MAKGKDDKNVLTIKIKYIDNEMPKVEKIDIGDWIDLRALEEYRYAEGEFFLINLGVAMELPEGYEAELKPRSSTFKNYGLIQVNSVGTIDNSYCSDSDIWKMPVYAIRPGRVDKYDRICQFRIVKTMSASSPVEFVEVESLDNKERGGFGGTGTK